MIPVGQIPNERILNRAWCKNVFITQMLVKRKEYKSK